MRSACMQCRALACIHQAAHMPPPAQLAADFVSARCSCMDAHGRGRTQRPGGPGTMRLKLDLTQRPQTPAQSLIRPPIPCRVFRQLRPQTAWCLRRRSDHCPHTPRPSPNVHATDAYAVAQKHADTAGIIGSSLETRGTSVQVSTTVHCIHMCGEASQRQHQEPPYPKTLGVTQHALECARRRAATVGAVMQALRPTIGLPLEALAGRRRT